MKLREYIEKNKGAFAGIENLDATLTALEAAADKAKINILANDLADPNKPTYVGYDRLKEVVDQRELFERQYKEVKAQVDVLGKDAKDKEALVAEISTLKTQLTETDAKTAKELAHVKVTSEARIAAMAMKAHSADDVVRFLELDNVQIGSDGKPVGIQEMLTKLKEEKTYLFAEEKSEEEEKKPNGGGNFGGNGGGKSLDEMTMEEYVKARSPETK